MATVFSLGSRRVVLPSPDFGNEEELNFDRISRKSRGGDLIVYRDPTWVHTETLKMQFSYMSQTRVNVMRQFVKDTLGQTVHLVDHEGYAWNGIITTPAAEMSQPGRENFTLKLEFQGTRTT